jgi:hypothetical protein
MLNLQDDTKSNFLDVGSSMAEKELINNALKSGNTLLALTMSAEGVKNKPYLDSAGRYHMGIGYDVQSKSPQEIRQDLQAIGVSSDKIRHFMKTLAEGKPEIELTNKQSVLLADRYYSKFEKVLEQKYGEQWHNFSDEVKSGLLYKAYNMGPNNLPKTLISELSNGNVFDLERQSLATYRQDFSVSSDLGNVNVKVRIPDLRNAYLTSASMNSEVLGVVLNNPQQLDKEAKLFKDEVIKQVNAKLQEMADSGTLKAGHLYSLKDLGIKTPSIKKLSEMETYKEGVALAKEHYQEKLLNKENEKTSEKDIVPNATSDVSNETKQDNSVVSDNKIYAVSDANLLDNDKDLTQMDIIEISDEHKLDVANETNHSKDIPLSRGGELLAYLQDKMLKISTNIKDIQEKRLAQATPNKDEENVVDNDKSVEQEQAKEVKFDPNISVASVSLDVSRSVEVAPFLNNANKVELNKIDQEDLKLDSNSVSKPAGKTEVLDKKDITPAYQPNPSPTGFAPIRSDKEVWTTEYAQKAKEQDMAEKKSLNDDGLLDDVTKINAKETIEQFNKHLDSKAELENAQKEPEPWTGPTSTF